MRHTGCKRAQGAGMTEKQDNQDKRIKREKLISQERSVKRTLSKRMRMLDSSEFKRQTFYALENMKRGNWAAKLV